MSLRRSALVLVLFCFAKPLWADETIHYQWKLQGFMGTLASLFVPGGGQGALSIRESGAEIERGELLITSSEVAAGDFFRYGAEWNRRTGRTERAWSELSWRGERKNKRSEVEAEGVIDIVSGIQMLRRNLPTSPRRMEIWSDGRLYPVLVLPRGSESRRLDGREVVAYHLEIRGLKVPDRKLWKGELDLWIANDPAATPIEIEVTRKGARVSLAYSGRASSTAADGTAKGGAR